MTHPLRQDYSLAIQNLHHFVIDPRLKTGQPILHQKTRKPLAYSGSYSSVYPVEVNGDVFAVRCWVADISRAEERYETANRFLASEPLPYFVDFQFLEQGIRVNGRTYPILLMEWANGLTLNKFLDLNHTHPDVILDLADTFATMVRDLHKRQIAHGDLQDGNLLIQKNGRGPVIKLIDYDGLFVPGLSNWPNEIYGLPAYQHPARFAQPTINEKLDYFSELVIYISLLAYAKQPYLWQRGQEQRLAFEEHDFNDPKQSRTFARMRGLSPELEYLVDSLQQYCLTENINELRPLEEVLAAVPAHARAFTKGQLTWDAFPTKPVESRKKARSQDNSAESWPEIMIYPSKTIVSNPQEFNQELGKGQHSQLDTFFNKGEQPAATVKRKSPSPSRGGNRPRPSTHQSTASTYFSADKIVSFVSGFVYAFVALWVGVLLADFTALFLDIRYFVPWFIGSVMLFIILAVGPAGLILIRRYVNLGSEKHFVIGSLVCWNIFLIHMVIMHYQYNAMDPSVISRMGAIRWLTASLTIPFLNY